MTNCIHPLRAAAVALCIGLLATATAPALAETITTENVAEMAANAKTAADHTAIAEYFRAQAETARKEAQKHRAMLVTGPSNKTSRSVWDAHCRRLIKSYEEQAATYVDLAKEQEVLAKHVAETH